MAARKDSKGRALKKGEFQRASDGKYAYSYRDPDGVRRYIYSKDLKKLRQRVEQLVKDQLDGLDVYVAGNADINFVFDRRMSTKSELGSNTRSNYIYMYDRFIRNGFGKRKIGSIKYSDVLQFYHDLLYEKDLQINTVEIIHTLLHPTFQLAVRDGVIRNNPSDGVLGELKKKSPGNKTGVRHALTLEQQKAFMAYMAHSPVFEKWSPFFTVLLGTGCRIGELIGLRWEDVDLDKRTININHQLTYYPRGDERKNEFRASWPKTKAGIRVIPMMDQVYNALQGEYDRQMEEGFSTVNVDGITGIIFTNRFGQPHNPQTVNRAIKRIYEAHNAEEMVKAKREHREPVIIPHFSNHHLRHTFCSRLCENDINPKVLQSLMGHASIETTMDIYAEVSEMTTKNKLDELATQFDIF